MASPREMNNPLSTADDKPRSLLSQDELRESLSLDQSSSPKGVDRTATMFEQEMVVANDSGEEDDGDEAKERSLATKSLLVTIQTGITLGFGPFAVLFLLTVVGDCLIFSPHIHGRNTEPKLEGSFIQFLNMIVFPAMSFGAASYMMVSYWMDSDSWTMLRRCLMFSTIPMIIFYGLMLMGQSENFQMGTTCTFRAYVMQVVYLQMNMWHTMTVLFMYRMVAHGTPKFNGAGLMGIRYKHWVHIGCWIVPFVLTTLMTLVPRGMQEIPLFHEDLWSTADYDSELDGIGWCGVDSRHRVLKAVFLNMPQLILVSFYAQFYYYIHQYVDPAEDGDVSGALGQTKISTSRNTGMMSTFAALRQASIEKAASQQRLYMVPYTLSFMLNTMMQLVTDNLTTGDISVFNLTIQAMTVTPQGFLIGIVYLRTSKNILTLYTDLWQKFLELKYPDKGAAFKNKRFKAAMKREAFAKYREKKMHQAAEKVSMGGISPGCITKLLWVSWNIVLFMPLSVWVWTPMEFLAEFLHSQSLVLCGLFVWGIMLSLPTYYYSLGRLYEKPCLAAFAIGRVDNDEESSHYGHYIEPSNPVTDAMFIDPKTLDPVDACVNYYEYFAEWYILFLIFISGVAVYQSRYAPHLLFVESPIRREGFMNSVGMGYRLNSLRNFMSSLTMTLEFYQIWGLTWGASEMDVLYLEKEYNETIVVGSWDEYNNSTLDYLSSNNTESSWSSGPQPHEWTEEDWDAAAFLERRTGYIDTRAGPAEKQDLYTYWFVVGMCCGWTFLYCLPHVITTTTVGNRTLAFNWQEAYRKYLWFMSGAGFLSILKALIKMTFCRPHPKIEDGTGPLVAMSDFGIVCWSPEHLQLVVVALGFLCIFFPSASLTCLFRYDDDDDMGFGSRKWRKGIGDVVDGKIDGRPVHQHDHSRGYAGNFPLQGGCVAGGEDMRWLHLWRRVEYIVKAIWVFAGYRMAGNPKYVAIVILSGSALIAFVNARMKPSCLQYVNMWKLEIHCANVWTTMTCLYANLVGFPGDPHTKEGLRDAKVAHLTFLFTGWLIITALIIYWEAIQLRNDVLLLDCSPDTPGGRQNQNKCKREARWLRRQIAFAVGTVRWATHAHITRLVRLAEHNSIEVSCAAFEELSVLCLQDTMTGIMPGAVKGVKPKGFHETNSFFLCLTPVDPTIMLCVHAIMTSKDADIKGYATQVLTSFLQLNIGNRVAKPITFHEALIAYDSEPTKTEYRCSRLPNHLPMRAPGDITRALCKYAIDKYNVAGTRNKSGLNLNLSAAQLVMETCNADSNKLVMVADIMLPMLGDWMVTGNLIQQYTGVHMVAMVANRFDLAKKVIDSSCMTAIVTLFHATASVYGRFSGETIESGVSETDSSRSNMPGIRKDVPMPSSFRCPGNLLPKSLKRRKDFLTDRLPDNPRAADASIDGDGGEGSGLEDDICIPTEFNMDSKLQTLLLGEILHDCIQAIVELAGASRATGRRLMLEAGATEVISTCLNFPQGGVEGFDASVEMSTHDDLLNEAMRGSHAFLSGRFSMEDIEFDDDFYHPFVFLSEWKKIMVDEQNWDAEVEVGSEMTAIQRRKAHIMCAFLQLDHFSVGTIGHRKVMASLSSKQKPRTAELDQQDRVKAQTVPDFKGINGAKPLPKPEWLVEYEKGPMDNDAEDRIFEWCWQEMATTGVAAHVMPYAVSDALDQSLRFHAVDILLKILEHNLDKDNDKSNIENIMRDALTDNSSHGLALMGATGLNVICMRKGNYRPYGSRSGSMKGKKLFRWAGTMIRWMIFWYTQSDGLPDFDSGEGGFHF